MVHPFLEDSYAHAGAVTRARAKNFYYTFLLLPRLRRRSIFAVYAFSRRADDAVDAAAERGAGAQEVRLELDRLRALLGPNAPDDPLGPALRDTMERFEIPRAPFDELLEGMEMDLQRTTYATFDELYLYCYRAASVVGLISIEIFGHTGDAVRQPAIDLGIAMQLTNILRDVREDLARGRIYLPAEDLTRFGYTADDLRAGVVDRRFRDLMAFEVERARAYFRAAEPLYGRILPESRYCPVLLQRFYSRILDRIEARGFDVISKRPSLPLREKLWIAGRTWLEARSRLVRSRLARSASPS
jgi:phytoene synthase